jgi:hypothetical protein
VYENHAERRALGDKLAPHLVTPVAHLARHYGTYAHDLAAVMAFDPALCRRIHPEGPDVWAQVVYAATDEWAVDADDVLLRRTTVGVRGLSTPQIRAEVTKLPPRRRPPAIRRGCGAAAADVASWPALAQVRDEELRGVAECLDFVVPLGEPVPLVGVDVIADVDAALS